MIDPWSSVHTPEECAAKIDAGIEGIKAFADLFATPIGA